MTPIVHPGRLLKRELLVRKLSISRASLDLGVSSAVLAGILNERRAISPEMAVRLGRYFNNRPQFWLSLQNQCDIGIVERETGASIARWVRRAKRL